MALLSAKTCKLRGVLIDTGTGQRIPMPRSFDPETGEYEHFIPAPNGIDVVGDECCKPILLKGKAKGRLKLVDFKDAATLGNNQLPPPRPKIVPQAVAPMTKDEEVEGLEVYKRCYFQVWSEYRKEAKKTVNDRWTEYLIKTGFFDNLTLTRVVAPVGVINGVCSTSSQDSYRVCTSQPSNLSPSNEPRAEEPEGAVTPPTS